jgi:Flp pilus assembly protein TadD
MLLPIAAATLALLQDLPETPASRPSPPAQSRPASPADARLQVAERAYQLRDYKRAESELLAARGLEPGRFDVHVRLGIVQYRLQHWSDAIASLEKALQLNPSIVGQIQVLGHCLYEMGDLDKALEAYDKTLAANPNNREALRGKGMTLERLGRYDESEAALRKAVALNPESDTFLLPLGRVLVRKKQYGAALPYLEKAKRLDPFDWEVEYELGRIYKALGDDVKAKASFERKEMLRVHQEAIRTLKVRFLNNPNDLTTLAQLATRYDLLGDTVNGEQTWARAVSLSRDNAAVACARAVSYVLTGNKPAAESLLRDRQRRYPNEPETWEILWFVLKERGDVKGAEDAAMRFKSLTQRDPVAPEIPKLDGSKGGAAESSPASEPARR